MPIRQTTPWVIRVSTDQTSAVHWYTTNPGAQRLLGYTGEEILGNHISIVAPEGLWPEQRALLRQMRSGKEVAPYDSVRRRKDGSLVQVSIKPAAILSPDGAPIGISETMRDMTQRKRADERTTRLRRHRVRTLQPSNRRQ